MDEPVGAIAMVEQDRQISRVVTERRGRLRNFIRRLVEHA